MDLGKISADGLFEDEEEEEDDSLMYGSYHGFNPSEEEIRRARERKAEHVYQAFVKPTAEGLDQPFTVEDVQEEIKPPYNMTEVQRALDYGVENKGLVYLEDQDSFRVDS